ncbi:MULTISPECIES: carbohydrate ABC transporter permease [Caldilinea]|jgi:multiple sugar transport system permease protein|nr:MULTISPECIES: carbohydrate ABC transporter permease [Caldilinea]MBO9391886.1 carbohydrate ABC transporter permease [Caldilinea sp.]
MQDRKVRQTMPLPSLPSGGLMRQPFAPFGFTALRRLASLPRRKQLERLLWHSLALGVAVLFAAPLVWLIIASLQPIGWPPPRTLAWFPHGVAWSNYVEIFRVAPLGLQIGNSLFVSAAGMLITLLTASWAGFAMSQLPPPSRGWLVGLALLLLLIPSGAVWMPRYVLFSNMGLIDTYAALVAPALFGTRSLLALMYYWSFRRISSELYESASLDGAGLWTVWRRIALPLARPTTLAVAVLAFSHYWSDFVDPLLFLKSTQRFTIAVGLRMLQQMDATNWPLLMAAVAVMIAPVLALYLLLQVVLNKDANFLRRVIHPLNE